MKCIRWIYLPFFLIFNFSAYGAVAQEIGALQVMPVRIDAQAPVTGGSLTMSNGGTRPMTVQVRVFKWLQQNGEDLYMPAKGVAVSPPMITLRPQSETVLRVVRTSGEPLTKEESYRVVIDQLPDPSLRRRKGTNVSFVVRHNIPVFFSPQGALEPQITWKVAAVKGGYQVTAVNSGTRHIGFSAVRLLAGKTVIGKLDGLAGYALAGTSGSFLVHARTGKMPDRIQAVDINQTPIDDVIRR